MIQQLHDFVSASLLRVGFQHAVKIIAAVFGRPFHAAFRAFFFQLNPIASRQIRPDVRPRRFAERLYKIILLHARGQRSKPPRALEREKIAEQSAVADAGIGLIGAQTLDDFFQLGQRLLARQVGIVRLSGGDTGQQFHPLADGRELGEGM